MTKVTARQTRATCYSENSTRQGQESGGLAAFWLLLGRKRPHTPAPAYSLLLCVHKKGTGGDCCSSPGFHGAQNPACYILLGDWERAEWKTSWGDKNCDWNQSYDRKRKKVAPWWSVGVNPMGFGVYVSGPEMSVDTNFLEWLYVKRWASQWLSWEKARMVPLLLWGQFYLQTKQTSWGAGWEGINTKIQEESDTVSTFFLKIQCK